MNDKLINMVFISMTSIDNVIITCNCNVLISMVINNRNFITRVLLAWS